ncbi:MAG TPA: ABC transporter permease [Xanthobacteraceae bacterium]|jgi:putative spermidine/putrescine transport system permease protein
MRARFERWSYVGALIALYLFLLLPLIFILGVSVNDGPTPTFPPVGISFHWYVHAIREESFVQGAVTSAWLAIAATVIATPLGTAAALGIRRAEFRGKRLVEMLFLAPLAVPGVVIGIALLIAFVGADIGQAPVRLVAAHILLVLPYSIRTVLASLAQIDPALEEAALTLGASRWIAFRLIVLPLIRSGIVAGVLFALILSFDDIALALFLVDANTATLPVAVLSYLQYNFDPSIAAVSSIVIILTLACASLVERTFGLQRLLGG